MMAEEIRLFFEHVSTKDEESETLATVVMSQRVQSKTWFCYCLQSLQVTMYICLYRSLIDISDGLCGLQQKNR